MRVGLDISPLRPPFTGVGNYALALLEAMLRVDSPHDFWGFAYRRWSPVDREFLDGIKARSGKLADSEPLGVGGGGTQRALRLLRALPAAHAASSAVRAALFDGSVRRRRIDVFHALVYRAPSRKPRVPVIPVVWDLSHVRHPDSHPRSRIRWMRHVEATCRNAPVIHTISQFTADEIVEVFGVPRDRIEVVPPAVSSVFRVAAESGPPERLGVTPGRYALSVSTLEPRKNLRTLLAAYATLTPAERSQMPLVVVGARGWGDLDLGREVTGLIRERSVIMAGYVPDAELARLYRHARVMLYPSIYEGFGMPVIEAMAQGTPVVVANAASLPEAAGGLGQLVGSRDVGGWSAALRTAMDAETSDARRARLRNHALSWRWEDAATAVLRMYRKAETHL